MPNKINILKKRSDFLNIRLKGSVYKSNSLILQKLFDEKLNNSIRIGYTATKKLGNAVKRNRAKRLMRELIKDSKIYDKGVNFSYVLIAKKSIFETPYKKLKEELKNLLDK